MNPYLKGIVATQKVVSKVISLGFLLKMRNSNMNQGRRLMGNEGGMKHKSFENKESDHENLKHEEFEFEFEHEELELGDLKGNEGRKLIIEGSERNYDISNNEDQKSTNTSRVFRDKANYKMTQKDRNTEFDAKQFSFGDFKNQQDIQNEQNLNGFNKTDASEIIEGGHNFKKVGLGQSNEARTNETNIIELIELNSSDSTKKIELESSDSPKDNELNSFHSAAFSLNQPPLNSISSDSPHLLFPQRIANIIDTIAPQIFEEFDPTCISIWF